MQFQNRRQFVVRSLAATCLLLGLIGAALADAPPIPPAQSPTILPPVAKPRVAPTQPPAPPSNPNQTALAMANPIDGSSFTGSGPAYSLASTPNMLGDVLSIPYFYIAGGNIALAGGDRGAKIADDSRPLPTDRFFFDENYFSESNHTANGALIGLNRYTLGLEKTFFDGLCSIEIKAPIDTGLSSTQSRTATTAGNEGSVFGDLQISPKVLLVETCDWALAAGVTLDLPTAPSALFINSPNTTTRIDDDSVHIEPFLGLQMAPTDRLFSIAYVQLDVDANGNHVLALEPTPPTVTRGILREPTLLYVDWSAGYWLFHDGPCECGQCDRCRNGYLTGVAPVIELHYTTSLQDAHTVANIRPLSERTDIFNITAGAQFEICRCSTFTLGCAAPLRTTPRDKEFGTELIAQFNRRF